MRAQTVFTVKPLSCVHSLLCASLYLVRAWHSVEHRRRFVGAQAHAWRHICEDGCRCAKLTACTQPASHASRGSCHGIRTHTPQNPQNAAHLADGYCYPGRGRGGDLPPRRECADLWLDALLQKLPNIELTLLIGLHAQRHFLGARRQPTLTETVRQWPAYAPEFIPLPHPSPRNTPWFQAHPWFEQDLVPLLRNRVQLLLTR